MSEEKTIRPEFDVHMLNDVGIRKARDIASCFSILPMPFCKAASSTSRSTTSYPACAATCAMP